MNIEYGLLIFDLIIYHIVWLLSFKVYIYFEWLSAIFLVLCFLALSHFNEEYDDNYDNNDENNFTI